MRLYIYYFNEHIWHFWQTLPLFQTKIETMGAPGNGFILKKKFLFQHIEVFAKQNFSWNLIKSKWTSFAQTWQKKLRIFELICVEKHLNWHLKLRGELMGHYDPKFSNEFVSIFEKEEIERSQVQKNLKMTITRFIVFS